MKNFFVSMVTSLVLSFVTSSYHYLCQKIMFNFFSLAIFLTSQSKLVKLLLDLGFLAIYFILFFWQSLYFVSFSESWAYILSANILFFFCMVYRN